MNPGGNTDSIDALREQIRSRREIFDKNLEFKEKQHALQADILNFQKVQFKKKVQLKKRQMKFEEDQKKSAAEEKKQKLEMEKAERTAFIETQQVMAKCLLAILAERADKDGDNKK